MKTLFSLTVLLLMAGSANAAYIICNSSDVVAVFSKAGGTTAEEKLPNHKRIEVDLSNIIFFQAEFDREFLCCNYAEATVDKKTDVEIAAIKAARDLKKQQNMGGN